MDDIPVDGSEVICLDTSLALWFALSRPFAC